MLFIGAKMNHDFDISQRVPVAAYNEEQPVRTKGRISLNLGGRRRSHFRNFTSLLAAAL